MANGLEDIIRTYENMIVPMLTGGLYVLLMGASMELVGQAIKFFTREKTNKVRGAMSLAIVGILQALGAYIIPTMAVWALPVAILVGGYKLVSSVTEEYRKDIETINRTKNITYNIEKTELDEKPGILKKFFHKKLKEYPLGASKEIINETVNITYNLDKDGNVIEKKKQKHLNDYLAQE